MRLTPPTYETTTTRVSSWPGTAFLLKLWLEAITSIEASIKKISTACSLFIRRGGSINCIVTGSRRYSRDFPQGGMEIPCLLEFTGSVEDAKHVEKLTRAAMGLPDVPSSLPPAPNREQNGIENAKRKIEVLDSESPTEADNSDPGIDTYTCSKKFKSSLTADEMDGIIMGRKLSDRHISFAQDLLKSQFGNINGLECTLMQSKNLVPVLPEDATKNELQVFHDRHDHWIAASNVLTVEAGQVAVYDSVYRTLDALTKDAIIRKFQCGTSKPPVIKLMNFQKQKESIDCGVFAIAVITAFAFGQETSTLKFVQEKMRPHLSTCF